MNVIFPMAGESARFGYYFKPFLSVDDKIFIERAIQPFLKHVDKIDRFFFIITKEQEEEYSVSEKLNELFSFEKFFVIIPEKTSGPYQTIQMALKNGLVVDDSSIICDCDHEIDVDYIFDNYQDFECIIPVWEIGSNEYHKWSKIVYNKGKISNIYEKDNVTSNEVFGIIGCIYFNNLTYFLETGKYVSDAIRKIFIDCLNINTYFPRKVSFFGDPDRTIDTFPDNYIGRKLDGASPAIKIVLKNDDGIFVRKGIEKISNGLIHVEKLKQQKSKLEKFSESWKGSTPTIINEYENEIWYSYDMEYLDPIHGWELLEFSDRKEFFLQKIIRGLNEQIYSDQYDINGMAWLNNHLHSKIFPRLKQRNDILSKVLNSHELIINGVSTKSLKSFFDYDISIYRPTKKCIVHGDLSFENIFVNSETEQIKFIDSDGSDFYDVPELDLGKMYQSMMMKYSQWNINDWSFSGNEFTLSEKFFDIENDLILLVDGLWSVVLNERLDNIQRKSIFFSVLHLIRLIPYKMKEHMNYAILSALLARYWLEYLGYDR